MRGSLQCQTAWCASPGDGSLSVRALVVDPSFDEPLHAPHRLRISAILDTASVEFGELHNRLGTSKSALSKHLSQLEGNGYVQNVRVTLAGRSRLRVSFTEQGREKYRAHKEALREILQTAGEPT